MSGSASLAPAAAVPPSPQACPLCGGGNGCAMAGGSEGDAPCWCVAASFGEALLARLPPASRGRSCICAACAAAAASAASRPA